MAKTYTLGKKERLKSRKAIEQLFSDGQRFTSSPYRVYYAATAAGILQAGVGVSSKLFKKATDRNRIKRLTREAWRLQKNSLQEELKSAGRGLQVFFIYSSGEMPVYQTVYKKIELIIKRLRQTIHENTAPGS